MCVWIWSVIKSVTVKSSIKDPWPGNEGYIWPVILIASLPRHDTQPRGPTGRALIAKCRCCDTNRTYHFVLHKTAWCSALPTHFPGVEFPYTRWKYILAVTEQNTALILFSSWTRSLFWKKKCFLMSWVLYFSYYWTLIGKIVCSCGWYSMKIHSGHCAAVYCTDWSHMITSKTFTAW